MASAPPIPRRDWKLPLLLAAAALAGMALRIAAAQGDYWLDEAWSAVFAREARTPGDVLFAINHDNNHFLNSFWLQLVGWGGSPLLGRALSIATGTLTIVVAGLIGARRGTIAASIMALLFALSPILVTYGSEARGYAPMLLALMTAIWIVDRDLFGDPLKGGPQWLGALTLLGMLGHVSMLFGVAALCGWVLIERGRHMPVRAALLSTFHLMGRAVAAVVAVLLLILLGALASPEGLRIGSLTAFSWSAFADAVAHMLAFTLGFPLLAGPPLLALLLLPFAVRRNGPIADRRPFLLIAIVGLPLLVALIRPDNSAFPRYYLLSAVGLLILLGDLLAAAILRRSGWGSMAAGLLLVASLIVDVGIVANRRGDPGRALDAMIRRAPGGTAVMLESGRDRAVLESAAASRVYQLLTLEDCAPARFLYMANNGTDPFPLAALRCGAAFRPIAFGTVYGLSGMDWQLYERVR